MYCETDGVQKQISTCIWYNLVKVLAWTGNFINIITRNLFLLIWQIYYAVHKVDIVNVLFAESEWRAVKRKREYENGVWPQEQHMHRKDYYINAIIIMIIAWLFTHWFCNPWNHNPDNMIKSIPAREWAGHYPPPHLCWMCMSDRYTTPLT